MRVSGTINGLPAIVIAATTAKSGVLLIAMVGDSRALQACALEDFELPALPKKLRRKMKAFVEAETRAAQRANANEMVQ